MKRRESGIEISLATLCDAQPVLEITLSAFEAYRGVLDPPTGVLSEKIEDVRRAIEGKGVAVARVDEMPVGAVRWEPRDEYLYAGRLAVLPEVRGTGVGSALMQFVEGRAAELQLPEVRVEVRSALPGNIAFFTNRGYVQIAINPHPRIPSATSETLAKRCKGKQ